MFLFERNSGAAWRCGEFAAAASTSTASPVESLPTPKLLLKCAKHQHRICCPSGRPPALETQPLGKHAAPACPAQAAPPPKPAQAKRRGPAARDPGATPPKSRFKAAVFQRTKRGVQTLSEPVDDLTPWLEDAASAPFASASETPQTQLHTGGGEVSPSGITAASSGPPSGAPLSPATARALARGFRAGDLALASAGPLQVWCRGLSTASRTPPAMQPQQPPVPAPGSPPRTAGQAPSSGAPQRPGPAGLRAGDGGDGLARGGHNPPGGNAVRFGGGGGAAAGEGGGGSGRGGGAAAGRDVDVDVLLLGPTGRPRDLSVLAAAVERLALRPAGRCCVGCVVLCPSRERVEALQEAAFALLSERGGGPGAMHVMSVHGGTGFREDVSGLRSQPPDVLIATPMRLFELITTEQVRLGHLFESVRVLILDGGEVLATRTLRSQVERLLRLLPNTPTYTAARRAPARGLLRNPAAPATSAAAAAVPASGDPRAPARALVTLMAAADYTAIAAGGAAAAGGGGAAAAAPSATHMRAQAPAPARQSGSVVATTGTAAAAVAAAGGGSAAAAALRRHADQLLAVGRPARHSASLAPPPAPPPPTAPPSGVGPCGAAAAAAAAAAPTSELRAVTRVALRSGFVTFRLGVGGGDVDRLSGDGHGYDADGGGGCGITAGSLAAAVAAALGEGPGEGPAAASPLTGRQQTTSGSESDPDLVVRSGVTRGSVAAPPVGSPSGATTAAQAEAAASASPGDVTERTSPGSRGPPSLSLSRTTSSPPPAVGFASAAAAASAASPPSLSPSSLPSKPPPPHQQQLVPLHALAVPYEEHLPYLYLIIRQHMLSEGRHKIAVQFPSAALAALYAALFRALGFPAALATGRAGRAGRQEAVRDLSAAHRGLLFCTETTGVDPGCGLSLVLWLVRQMAAVQQAAAAAIIAASDAAAARERQPTAAAPPLPPPPLPPPQPPPLPPLPRCLVMLHDVDSPRSVAVAAAEALAVAGLGRVVPVQPGAWSGQLDSVSRRIEAALPKVSPALKLEGLEGLMGYMWAARAAAAAAAAAAAGGAAAAAGGGGGGGGGAGGGGAVGNGGGGGGGGAGGGGEGWLGDSAGLGPQPEQQLGVWARRFATALGMPQPPLLSRHVAARMGLRSVPGVTLVDFHAARPQPPQPPPPPARTRTRPRGLVIRLRLKALRQAKQQQQLAAQREAERRAAQEAKQRRREERQRRHQELLARQREAKEARLRRRREAPQPPEVIGRYQFLRALKRRNAASAARAAGQEQGQGQKVQGQKMQGPPVAREGAVEGGGAGGGGRGGGGGGGGGGAGV
ncbi:hypothetical protein PLESTF_001733300 [Pleodorina starrii]|nr:hypothetical protein PLESTM_000426600 [Pleodorina starrii]GLC76089.1 hypothetical protein PLESTF_001733300 [Pleodorina starrii]